MDSVALLTSALAPLCARGERVALERGSPATAARRGHGSSRAAWLTEEPAQFLFLRLHVQRLLRVCEEQCVGAVGGGQLLLRVALWHPTRGRLTHDCVLPVRVDPHAEAQMGSSDAERQRWKEQGVCLCAQLPPLAELLASDAGPSSGVRDKQQKQQQEQQGKKGRSKKQKIAVRLELALGGVDAVLVAGEASIRLEEEYWDGQTTEMVLHRLRDARGVDQLPMLIQCQADHIFSRSVPGPELPLLNADGGALSTLSVRQPHAQHLVDRERQYICLPLAGSTPAIWDAAATRATGTAATVHMSVEALYFGDDPAAKNTLPSSVIPLQAHEGLRVCCQCDWEALTPVVDNTKTSTTSSPGKDGAKQREDSTTTATAIATNEEDNEQQSQVSLLGLVTDMSAVWRDSVQLQLPLPPRDSSTASAPCGEAKRAGSAAARPSGPSRALAVAFAIAKVRDDIPAEKMEEQMMNNVVGVATLSGSEAAVLSNSPGEAGATTTTAGERFSVDSGAHSHTGARPDVLLLPEAAYDVPIHNTDPNGSGGMLGVLRVRLRVASAWASGYRVTQELKDFVSTAHSDEDLHTVISAFVNQAGVHALVSGLLKKTSSADCLRYLEPMLRRLVRLHTMAVLRANGRGRQATTMPSGTNGAVPSTVFEDTQGPPLSPDVVMAVLWGYLEVCTDDSICHGRTWREVRRAFAQQVPLPLLWDMLQWGIRFGGAGLGLERDGGNSIETGGQAAADASRTMVEGVEVGSVNWARVRTRCFLLGLALELCADEDSDDEDDDDDAHGRIHQESMTYTTGGADTADDDGVVEHKHGTRPWQTDHAASMHGHHAEQRFAREAKRVLDLLLAMAEKCIEEQDPAVSTAIVAAFVCAGMLMPSCLIALSSDMIGEYINLLAILYVQSSSMPLEQPVAFMTDIMQAALLMPDVVPIAPPKGDATTAAAPSLVATQTAGMRRVAHILAGEVDVYAGDDSCDSSAANSSAGKNRFQPVWAHASDTRLANVALSSLRDVAVHTCEGLVAMFRHTLKGLADVGVVQPVGRDTFAKFIEVFVVHFLPSGVPKSALAMSQAMTTAEAEAAAAVAAGAGAAGAGAAAAAATQSNATAPGAGAGAGVDPSAVAVDVDGDRESSLVSPPTEPRRSRRRSSTISTLAAHRSSVTLSGGASGPGHTRNRSVGSGQWQPQLHLLGLDGGASQQDAWGTGGSNAVAGNKGAGNGGPSAFRRNPMKEEPDVSSVRSALRGPNRSFVPAGNRYLDNDDIDDSVDGGNGAMLTRGASRGRLRSTDPAEEQEQHSDTAQMRGVQRALLADDDGAGEAEDASPHAVVLRRRDSLAPALGEGATALTLAVMDTERESASCGQTPGAGGHSTDKRVRIAQGDGRELERSSTNAALALTPAWENVLPLTFAETVEFANLLLNCSIAMPVVLQATMLHCTRVLLWYGWPNPLVVEAHLLRRQVVNVPLSHLEPEVGAPELSPPPPPHRRSGTDPDRPPTPPPPEVMEAAGGGNARQGAAHDSHVSFASGKQRAGGPPRATGGSGTHNRNEDEVQPALPLDMVALLDAMELSTRLLHRQWLLLAGLVKLQEAHGNRRDQLLGRESDLVQLCAPPASTTAVSAAADSMREQGLDSLTMDTAQAALRPGGVLSLGAFLAMPHSAHAESLGESSAGSSAAATPTTTTSLQSVLCKLLLLDSEILRRAALWLRDPRLHSRFSHHHQRRGSVFRYGMSAGADGTVLSSGSSGVGGMAGDSAERGEDNGMEMDSAAAPNGTGSGSGSGSGGANNHRRTRTRRASVSLVENTASRLAACFHFIRLTALTLLDLATEHPVCCLREPPLRERDMLQQAVSDAAEYRRLRHFVWHQWLVARIGMIHGRTFDALLRRPRFVQCIDTSWECSTSQDANVLPVVLRSSRHGVSAQSAREARFEDYEDFTDFFVGCLIPAAMESRVNLATAEWWRQTVDAEVSAAAAARATTAEQEAKAEPGATAEGSANNITGSQQSGGADSPRTAGSLPRQSSFRGAAARSPSKRSGLMDAEPDSSRAFLARMPDSVPTLQTMSSTSSYFGDNDSYLAEEDDHADAFVAPVLAAGASRRRLVIDTQSTPSAADNMASSSSSSSSSAGGPAPQRTTPGTDRGGRIPRSPSRHTAASEAETAANFAAASALRPALSQRGRLDRTPSFSEVAASEPRSTAAAEAAAAAAATAESSTVQVHLDPRLQSTVVMNCANDAVRMYTSPSLGAGARMAAHATIVCAMRCVALCDCVSRSWSDYITEVHTQWQGILARLPDDTDGETEASQQQQQQLSQQRGDSRDGGGGGGATAALSSSQQAALSMYAMRLFEHLEECIGRAEDTYTLCEDVVREFVSWVELLAYQTQSRLSLMTSGGDNMRDSELSEFWSVLHAVGVNPDALPITSATAAAAASVQGRDCVLRLVHGVLVDADVFAASLRTPVLRRFASPHVGQLPPGGSFDSRDFLGRSSSHEPGALVAGIGPPGRGSDDDASEDDDSLLAARCPHAFAVMELLGRETRSQSRRGLLFGSSTPARSVFGVPLNASASSLEKGPALFLTDEATVTEVCFSLRNLLTSRTTVARTLCQTLWNARHLLRDHNREKGSAARRGTGSGGGLGGAATNPNQAVALLLAAAQRDVCVFQAPRLTLIQPLNEGTDADKAGASTQQQIHQPQPRTPPPSNRAHSPPPSSNRAHSPHRMASSRTGNALSTALALASPTARAARAGDLGAAAGAPNLSSSSAGAATSVDAPAASNRTQREATAVEEMMGYMNMALSTAGVACEPVGMHLWQLWLARIRLLAGASGMVELEAHQEAVRNASRSLLSRGYTEAAKRLCKSVLSFYQSLNTTSEARSPNPRSSSVKGAALASSSSPLPPAPALARNSSSSSSAGGGARRPATEVQFPATRVKALTKEVKRHAETIKERAGRERACRPLPVYFVVYLSHAPWHGAQGGRGGGGGGGPRRRREFLETLRDNFTGPGDAELLGIVPLKETASMFSTMSPDPGSPSFFDDDRSRAATAASAASAGHSVSTESAAAREAELAAHDPFWAPHEQHIGLSEVHVVTKQRKEKEKENETGGNDLGGPPRKDASSLRPLKDSECERLRVGVWTVWRMHVDAYNALDGNAKGGAAGRGRRKPESFLSQASYMQFVSRLRGLFPGYSVLPQRTPFPAPGPHPYLQVFLALPAAGRSQMIPSTRPLHDDAGSEIDEELLEQQHHVGRGSVHRPSLVLRGRLDPAADAHSQQHGGQRHGHGNAGSGVHGGGNRTRVDSDEMSNLNGDDHRTASPSVDSVMTDNVTPFGGSASRKTATAAAAAAGANRHRAQTQAPAPRANKGGVGSASTNNEKTFMGMLRRGKKKRASAAPLAYESGRGNTAATADDSSSEGPADESKNHARHPTAPSGPAVSGPASTAMHDFRRQRVEGSSTQTSPRSTHSRRGSTGSMRDIAAAASNGHQDLDTSMGGGASVMSGLTNDGTRRSPPPPGMGINHHHAHAVGTSQPGLALQLAGNGAASSQARNPARSRVSVTIAQQRVERAGVGVTAGATMRDRLMATGGGVLGGMDEMETQLGMYGGVDYDGGEGDQFALPEDLDAMRRLDAPDTPKSTQSQPMGPNHSGEAARLVRTGSHNAQLQDGTGSDAGSTAGLSRLRLSSIAGMGGRKRLLDAVDVDEEDDTATVAGRDALNAGEDGDAELDINSIMEAWDGEHFDWEAVAEATCVYAYAFSAPHAGVELCDQSLSNKTVYRIDVSLNTLESLGYERRVGYSMWIDGWSTPCAVAASVDFAEVPIASASADLISYLFSVAKYTCDAINEGQSSGAFAEPASRHGSMPVAWSSTTMFSSLAAVIELFVMASPQYSCPVGLYSAPEIVRDAREETEDAWKKHRRKVKQQYLRDKTQARQKGWPEPSQPDWAALERQFFTHPEIDQLELIHTMAHRMVGRALGMLREHKCPDRDRVNWKQFCEWFEAMYAGQMEGFL